MKWDAMLNKVIPYVRGCPELLALDHLVEAARVFCGRTLVWNYSTVPIASSAGLARYTLQIGEGEELVRLLGVEVNGAHYNVPSGMTGRRMQRDKTSNTAVLEGNNDFVLEPAPHLDGLQIITDVAVKPRLVDPPEWPDDLTEHVTDFAHGAIATLCEVPNATWTNAETAKTRGGRFEDRIQTVALKVSKGFGRSRIGAAVQWF